MNCKTNFIDYVSNINLQQYVKDELRDKYKILVERLKKEPIGEHIIASFLQGSVARDTATKSVKSDKADIDIVVVTDFVCTDDLNNKDTYKKTPEQALNAFRDFLNKYYSGKWRKQGRSLGIEMSNCCIDLVPTALPSPKMKAILREMFSDTENYTKQDLQDLIDNGPKNEIYLQKNQTLLLNLKTDRVAQIGLKALNAQTSYSINDAAAQTLNASTDMFYTVKNRDDATSTITITNTGEGILAITKLKICDAPADAIQPITEQNVTDALIGLGYVDATKYADATANINLVDYTGKILASTSLTANGEEGTEATFAAADIQTLAEQLMPEGYAFVDVSAITDQTVVCGESADINVQIGKVATLNVTYKTLFGKTAGTATLTAVQTSSASSYTFSASEIREAAPSGFWTGTLISTKVKYGSTGSRTVIGF